MIHDVSSPAFHLWRRNLSADLCHLGSFCTFLFGDVGIGIAEEMGVGVETTSRAERVRVDGNCPVLRDRIDADIVAVDFLGEDLGEAVDRALHRRIDCQCVIADQTSSGAHIDDAARLVRDPAWQNGAG
jgi:hypothetical protein